MIYLSAVSGALGRVHGNYAHADACGGSHQPNQAALGGAGVGCLLGSWLGGLVQLSPSLDPCSSETAIRTPQKKCKKNKMSHMKVIESQKRALKTYEIHGKPMKNR